MSISVRRPYPTAIAGPNAAHFAGEESIVPSHTLLARIASSQVHPEPLSTEPLTLADIQVEREDNLLNGVIEEASRLTTRSLKRCAFDYTQRTWNTQKALIERVLGFTDTPPPARRSGAASVGPASLGVTQADVTLLRSILRASVAHLLSPTALSGDSGVAVFSEVSKSLVEAISRGYKPSTNFVDMLGCMQYMYSSPLLPIVTPATRCCLGIAYLNSKYFAHIQEAVKGVDLGFFEWRERPNIQLVARFLVQAAGPVMQTTSATRPATVLDATGRQVAVDRAGTFGLVYSLFCAGFYDDVLYLVTAQTAFREYPVLAECLTRLATALAGVIKHQLPLDAETIAGVRGLRTELRMEYQENLPTYTDAEVDGPGLQGLYSLLCGGTQNDQPSDLIFHNAFEALLQHFIDPTADSVETTMSARRSRAPGLTITHAHIASANTNLRAYLYLLQPEFTSFLTQLARSASTLELFIGYLGVRLLLEKRPDLCAPLGRRYSGLYVLNGQATEQHDRYSVPNIGALLEATDVSATCNAAGDAVSPVSIVLGMIRDYMGRVNEVTLTESHLTLARVLPPEDQAICLGILLPEALETLQTVSAWLGALDYTLPLFPLACRVGALKAEYTRMPRDIATRLYVAGEFYEVAAENHAVTLLQALATSVSITQDQHTEYTELTGSLRQKTARAETLEVLDFASLMFESRVQLLGFRNTAAALDAYSRTRFLEKDYSTFPWALKSNIDPILQYSYVLLRHVRVEQHQDIMQPAVRLNQIAAQARQGIGGATMVDLMSLTTL
ncbi:hypothetical protein GMRT_13853 [Giardia muris]|uniref:Uncharacterized protein n=1 Tax=Giardia muris TaxID=5742 RepID=A0A4Z1SNI8_GIAMU|nr:hypothetical protein GMRT_13853 [Giardia muris]|eukprot:TNJ27344.1 hypothetical protein GMRT_13853 [Giardia muris]